MVYYRSLWVYYLLRGVLAGALSGDLFRGKSLHQIVQNNTYISGRHYRFFQELAKLNLADEWKTLDTDVLAIWGKSDFIGNRADSELIASTVSGSHPGRARFLALEGVDHNFAHQDEMLDSFAPTAAHSEIAATLRDWYGELTDWITFSMPDDPGEDDAVAKVIASLRSG